MERGDQYQTTAWAATHQGRYTPATHRTFPTLIAVLFLEPFARGILKGHGAILIKGKKDQVHETGLRMQGHVPKKTDAIFSRLRVICS